MDIVYVLCWTTIIVISTIILVNWILPIVFVYLYMRAMLKNSLQHVKDALEKDDENV